jgi:thiol-disulfide isomerase/thioredoxin
MAKLSSRRGAHPLARERRAARRPNIAWRRWALVAGGILGLVLLVFLAQTGANSGGGSPAAESLARENAGTEVKVLAGSHHTVYHSSAPLPTSKDPRADGRTTLVWFSGTWCEFCEQMEPWAHATAAEYAERMVFVEKSVDHDREAASRYAVRGTPTFVLIDATGRPIAQFFFQQSRTAFSNAIEQALSRVNAGS